MRLRARCRKGAGRLLAGVDGGRKLRGAEHVHHTLIADAVAAAEFAVGVVVGHAPAEAARHALLSDGVVEDGGVAQGLCQAVGLVVEGLGRELGALELADEIAFPGVRVTRCGPRTRRRARGRSSRCRRIHLPEAGCGRSLGTGRGAGGVEAAYRLVGALIKLVVGAAADPHTPQKDAGVAAALADHLAAVLQSLRFQMSSPTCRQPGISTKTKRPSSSQASRKAGLGGVVRRTALQPSCFSGAERPAAGCCRAWHSPDRRSSGGG